MPIFKTKDNNFFKHWSPEMAYVLGYFAADGSMTCNRRGSHYIEFYATDQEIIKNVQSVLKSNLKISTFIRNKKQRKIYRIQVGSKQMFLDLIKLGFKPYKNKRLNLPNVPYQYLNHFVRGYFDGDGNVNYCRYLRRRCNGYSVALQTRFISGCKDFLVSLMAILKKTAKLKGGSICFSGGAYRLGYSKSDSMCLFDFLYKNANSNLLLKRKYTYFQKAIKAINSPMQQTVVR